MGRREAIIGLFLSTLIHKYDDLRSLHMQRHCEERRMSDEAISVRHEIASLSLAMTANNLGFLYERSLK